MTHSSGVIYWWSNASPIMYPSFLWKEVDKGFLRRQNRRTLKIFLWKRSEYLFKMWKVSKLTVYWPAMHNFPLSCFKMRALSIDSCGYLASIRKSSLILLCWLYGCFFSGSPPPFFCDAMKYSLQCACSSCLLWYFPVPFSSVGGRNLHKV